MAPARLIAEPLTRAAFEPFGDVIETQGAEHFAINNGTTERYHDLANIDVTGEGARVIANIFCGEPWVPPIEIKMLERHPLGSQAFMPIGPHPYLAVVADSGADGLPGELKAFLCQCDQGVNYARGIWHHPLLSLEARSDFLVIDRGGPGINLEERTLPSPMLLELSQ